MQWTNRAWLRFAFSMALGIALTAGPASAQSRSLFGSSSILSSGSSSTGTSMGTGSFGSTTGSSAFGSTTGGMGTGGTTGAFGSTAIGTTSNMGFNQQGMVGTSNRTGNTQGRFLGANATGNQQGQFGQGGQNRNGMNQMGLGATGQAGRGQTGRGRNSQTNQQNMQGMNQMGRGGRVGATTSTLRPQQRVAFEFDTPTYVERQTALRTRFESSGSPASLKGVEVALDNAGIARLQGTVASEDARKLAAILVRLEPGVKSVQNDLVVGAKSDPAP